MSGEVRSVVVRLSASVAGYLSGMGQADAATAKVEHGLERLNKKTLTTDQVMGKVGKAGGRLFVGAAAGIAVAEKKAADFNAEMATVYTLSHATTRQQEQLAKAAKTVGIGIGVGATDAAKAEEELIKAGVSLKDIMGGGLKGALDLASAGQTDVASATEVAASAMTQFNIKGKDVPHIADLLAAGADKALGSVTDLGYGLSQVGTQAHQMGFSIEDTVGTLAEFAQSGLTGERGGTVLKQMFLQLAAPTEKAGKLMKRYGLSLYDANGQIKTMPELADNLQRSFKNLTPAQRNMALGVIFGSRAIQGANILIKDGEKKNRAWIKSVNDQGFAAHQASGKMDSLKGDLKKLGAALDNSFIDTAGDQSGLRGLVKDITSLVKAYNRLSDSQKGLVLKGFEGAAAVGGSLWVANKIYAAAKGTAGLYRGIGALLSKKTAATVAGDALGGSIGRKGVVPVFVTNEGFGGPGGAAGAASAAGKGAGAAEGAVVGAAATRAGAAKMVLSKVAITAGSVVLAGQLAQGISSLLDATLPQTKKDKSDPLFKDFRQEASGFFSDITGRNSLKRSINNVSDLKGGGGLNGFGTRSSQQLGKLFTFGQWGSGLDDDQKRVKKLDDSLSALTRSNRGRGLDEFNKILENTGLKAEDVRRALPETAKALDGVAAESKKAKGAEFWDGMIDGATKAVIFAGKYAGTLHTIPKEIRSYVSTPGSVQSLSDMRRIAKQYHLTPKQILTIMRLQGFSETQAQIAAAGQSYRSLPKQVKTALRADTVKSIADVRRLQKQYHLTPAQVRTVMRVSGVDKAIAQARALRNEIAAIKSKSINITIHRGNAPTGPSVGPYAPDASADGSTVPKTGRGYADRHHYLLADGEEVVSNRYGQADRHRGLLKAINANRLADGGTTGFVSGGKGTPSVTVTFPPPAVYAAAVKAADDIAAAAVKTTATAKDLRAVHLDDLHQQQQIRDLNKSLNEHNKKTVGKGKSRHTVKGKFTLTGLDRTTAKAELADAKATLVEMRKQSDVAKQLADARAEARQALQDARKDATDSITGGLDLFSHSAGGAAAYVDRYTVDVAKFGNVLARLRGTNASPMLLQKMVELANQGDFRSATRFGQALLDQPALLAQLNTSLSSFSQVAGGVANLSTDPRFLTTAAWNPTGQVASTKVEVQLGVDPSTWTTDITRRVTANVLAAINGGR